jgi:plasmid stability protein
MAQIIVRNLDDTVVTRLKARARANGRSLEAEARLILKQSVEVAQEKSSKVDMATARQHVMEIRKKLADRKFPDSVELIREDRER